MAALKSLPRIDRPREKLISRGTSALSDAELLAVLLGSGVHGKNVLSVARSLLRSKLFPKANFPALKKQKGIGEARACLLMAALELGRRFFQKEDDEAPVFSSPESVYQYTKELASHRKEHFIALYLNAKNRLLKRETISIGSLFSTQVHPREVFTPALSVSAAGIVLIHNHPSGDPEPSPEDRILTKRLVEVGALMGIDILDHLIIGGKSFVSFQDRHYLSG